ncbi:Spy/CpxP family protein refolding chaperone [bacterium]|nr:Spy/CpxP family protein refolding chaperone [bacterium]
MTKKTSIYISVALVALLGIFATCVYAAPNGKSGGFKSAIKAHKAARMGAMLGITDEQKDEIRGTLEGYRDDFKPLVEGMIDAQRTLRDTVSADNFSESAIRKASDGVGDYRAELAVLAGKAYQDVSDILTPEQIDIVKEFKEMRRNHIDDFLGFLEKLPGL